MKCRHCDKTATHFVTAHLKVAESRSSALCDECYAHVSLLYIGSSWIPNNVRIDEGTSIVNWWIDRLIHGIKLQPTGSSSNVKYSEVKIPPVTLGVKPSFPSMAEVSRQLKEFYSRQPEN